MTMAFRHTINVNPIEQFRYEMDRLVSNVFANPAVAGATRMVSGRGFPAVNLWESDDNLYLEAELPGLKAENLDVTVVGSELTLKGERPDGPPPADSFHRRERGTGAFTRLIRLPSEVNADGVEASLNDGVLLLTLPKAETAKPRKIKVNGENS